MDRRQRRRWTYFDVYPFILLNFAFSLQAAYTAPLILLAQTRQARRTPTPTRSTARSWARANLEQAARMMELLEQNTELTWVMQEMSRWIAERADQIHRRVVSE